MKTTKQVRDDIKLLIKENLEHWKSYIPETCENDCNIEDCECLTNCLTVGIDEAGETWSFQTGDNSYTGGAYGCPHWAVTWFSRETTIEELQEQVLEEIELIIEDEG